MAAACMASYNAWRYSERQQLEARHRSRSSQTEHDNTSDNVVGNSAKKVVPSVIFPPLRFEGFWRPRKQKKKAFSIFYFSPHFLFLSLLIFFKVFLQILGIPETKKWYFCLLFTLPLFKVFRFYDFILTLPGKERKERRKGRQKGGNTHVSKGLDQKCT